MTDNEKRAHDLAIQYVQIYFKTLLSKSEPCSNLDFHVYVEYRDSYDSNLERLNSEYPENS